jgi:hypothetical protein
MKSDEVKDCLPGSLFIPNFSTLFGSRFIIRIAVIYLRRLRKRLLISKSQDQSLGIWWGICGASGDTSAFLFLSTIPLSLRRHTISALNQTTPAADIWASSTCRNVITTAVVSFGFICNLGLTNSNQSTVTNVYLKLTSNLSLPSICNLNFSVMLEIRGNLTHNARVCSTTRRSVVALLRDYVLKLLL